MQITITFFRLQTYTLVMNDDLQHTNLKKDNTKVWAEHTSYNHCKHHLYWGGGKSLLDLKCVMDCNESLSIKSIKTWAWMALSKAVIVVPNVHLNNVCIDRHLMPRNIIISHMKIHINAEGLVQWKKLTHHSF